ncbi:hypothetical protein ACHAQJ_001179 [Trichoderma viride]
MHQSEKQQDGGNKQQSPKRRESKKLSVYRDEPKENDPEGSDPEESGSKVDNPEANVPKAVAQPERPATRAKAAGKGQLESPTTSSNSSFKSGKSPQSSQSSQSTPSPIRRMRRIVQPPRDPNKPTMLQLKFTSNKGLKRTSGNSRRSVLSTKPANATPIKDRGLRASLE